MVLFPQEIANKIVTLSGVTQDEHVALVVMLVLFGYFTIIVLLSGGILYAYQFCKTEKGSSSRKTRKTGAVLKGAK